MQLYSVCVNIIDLSCLYVDGKLWVLIACMSIHYHSIYVDILIWYLLVPLNLFHESYLYLELVTDVSVCRLSPLCLCTIFTVPIAVIYLNTVV